MAGSTGGLRALHALQGQHSRQLGHTHVERSCSVDGSHEKEAAEGERSAGGTVAPKHDTQNDCNMMKIRRKTHSRAVKREQHVAVKGC